VVPIALGLKITRPVKIWPSNAQEMADLVTLLESLSQSKNLARTSSALALIK
jgi:hypothetical protein